jgi:hypothetical protein
MPANRVAVVVHVAVVWCAALAAFISAISGTFPLGWQDTALAIGGVLGGVAGSLPVILKFLDGAQKSEALTVHAAATAGIAPTYDERVTGKRITGEEPINVA